MAPELGSTPLQTGPAFVCLDAGPLIYFNDTDRLDRLEQFFGPTAYTPQAVIELELMQRPKQNAPVLALDWLQWVPSHPDDAELVARLVRRFGGPPKHQGEAEVIAASKRYGWVAVLDDDDARIAAKEEGVVSVYTVTVLAAAAAEGKLTPSQAWKAHVAIEKSRGRYSPLKPDEAYKDVFYKFVDLLRQLRKKRGEPPWPHVLASGGLDDLLLRLLDDFQRKG